MSYEAADTDTAHSTLTVRDAIDGERRPVPADGWAFGTCPSGEASLAPSTMDICLFDGFDPDKVYELIYPARNPWVMGLGYAATRDVASFLRYQTADDAGTPNPLAASAESVGVRRVYGLGISSTGMYLRDWLYLGFNEDEAHRRVFDAVRIHIPGTHRLFANVEFADPNIYSRQDRTSDFTSQSYPPLTYAVTTDPVTNVRDGILKRPATDPLVFHVDTSNEFWQMKASLNVHDGRGDPVPIPDNVRLYLLAGHPHGGAAGVGAMPTDRGACEYVTNTYRSAAPTMRALLVALDAWADRGIEPPASRYPDVRRGTLATVDEVGRTFPAIPGVLLSDTGERARRARLRPHFRIAGRPADRAAADPRRVVPGARAHDGPRRARHRRDPLGGHRRAGRDQHRLEPARGRPARGRPLLADRIVLPVLPDARGAGGQRRPAPVIGGTLRRPRGLRRRGPARRRRVGRPPDPAARGRRGADPDGGGE